MEYCVGEMKMSLMKSEGYNSTREVRKLTTQMASQSGILMTLTSTLLFSKSIEDPTELIHRNVNKIHVANNCCLEKLNGHLQL